MIASNYNFYADFYFFAYFSWAKVKDSDYLGFIIYISFLWTHGLLILASF